MAARAGRAGPASAGLAGRTRGVPLTAAAAALVPRAAAAAALSLVGPTSAGGVRPRAPLTPARAFLLPTRGGQLPSPHRRPEARELPSLPPVLVPAGRGEVTIAVVGRPNVGKSSLVNRLSGQAASLVKDVPGTTRDRVYASSEWRGFEITLVDTGGVLDLSSTELLPASLSGGTPERPGARSTEAGSREARRALDAAVRAQAAEALSEADLILLVVDGVAGLTSADADALRWARSARPGAPCLLAVSKCEPGSQAALGAPALWDLGLEPHPISSASGTGTGDLLDAALALLGSIPDDEGALRAEVAEDRKRRRESRAAWKRAELRERLRGRRELTRRDATAAPAARAPEGGTDPGPGPDGGVHPDPGREGGALPGGPGGGREGEEGRGGGGAAAPPPEGDPPSEPPGAADRPLRVALLGRPNVGKSSLLNAIAGETRAIVSDVPGTTRDCLDAEVEATWRDGSTTRFTLVDTAGIRRRARVEASPDAIERLSAQASRRALARCDVAALVVDASRGVAAQDVRLASEIHAAGAAAVVVVSKWDTVDEDEVGAAERRDASVRRAVKPLDYANLVFCSATTGENVRSVLRAARAAHEQSSRRVTTATLNLVLSEALRARQPPPDRRNKTPALHYATQVATNPPTIALFGSAGVRDLPETYRAFVLRKFREATGFPGAQIRLLWRAKETRGGGVKPGSRKRAGSSSWGKRRGAVARGNAGG